MLRVSQQSSLPDTSKVFSKPQFVPVSPAWCSSSCMLPLSETVHYKLHFCESQNQCKADRLISNGAFNSSSMINASMGGRGGGGGTLEAFTALCSCLRLFFFSFIINEEYMSNKCSLWDDQRCICFPMLDVHWGSFNAPLPICHELKEPRQDLNMEHGRRGTCTREASPWFWHGSSCGATSPEVWTVWTQTLPSRPAPGCWSCRVSSPGGGHGDVKI